MYTQKKPIENAHIVRERDRRRFRELSAVLFLAVPVGAFLLVFTWQNVQVIQLGRDATRLQARRKVIDDANKSLQLELDRLTALDAVERKASALGFEPTEPGAIVMVTPDALPAPIPTADSQSQQVTNAPIASNTPASDPATPKVAR